MPFGLGKKTQAIAAEPEIVEPRAVIGDRACSERGCERHDAATCGYLDRRGRGCATAWCAEHQQLFDGRAFCRRHVGTLRAIGLDAVQGTLAPDLDNRAPSLVNWICNDLDARMRAFLAAQIAAGSGEELGEDRVLLVRAADGARRWERSWKLLDHTGITAKVTVAVEESDDTKVLVRLGGRALASIVPPWIDRRIRRIDVDAETDMAERRVFYDWLFDVVSGAVVEERTHTQPAHY